MIQDFPVNLPYLVVQAFLVVRALLGVPGDREGLSKTIVFQAYLADDSKI